MSADELADSLVKQKQINEVEATSGKGLSKRIKELKEAGESEKAAELEKQVLAGKSVALAEQELSNTEKMAESADKLKQSFMQFMVGPVSKAMNFFSGVIESISNSKILSALVGGIGLAATAAGILMVGRSIINAFKAPKGDKRNPMHVIVDGGNIGGRTGKGGSTRSKRGGKLGKIASIAGGLGIGEMMGDESGSIDSILDEAENMSSGDSPSSSKKSMPPRDPKTGRFMKKGGKGLLGKGGKLLTGLKGGIGGLIAGIVVDAAADAAKESGNKSLGKGLDVTSGALSGAGTGALIGSVIPGIGTAIGGAIGGLIGGGMSYFSEDEPQLAIGGIVTKPTRALVGEAGSEAVIPLTQFYAKLDE
jgi:hypothetical protein